MNKNEAKLHHQELETLELKIAKFLRFGVFSAGGLMVVGWGMMVLSRKNGDPFEAFRNYEPRSLLLQLQEVWANQNYATMLSYFGLFVLISLPVIRVALTAVLFIKQQEKILASIAFLVLLALFYSFTQGIDF